MVLAQHGVPRRVCTRLRGHASPIAQSLTSGKRMDKATELAIVRRTYAKHVLAEAQVEDLRIEAAFATVPREDFLGSGPWLMPRWLIGPVHTPTPDPIYLYSDKVVQIVPERHLNNGLPSAHAKWIAAARPAEGEHVVHIGTGTGYYTAISCASRGACWQCDRDRDRSGACRSRSSKLVLTPKCACHPRRRGPHAV